ncbi:MAG TPA: tyrosine-type recombinase/integrase [Rectinemataceae bacterium]|nr:tyrosine-type recombinase/integrase [Rectinemataceae bacterium]
MTGLRLGEVLALRQEDVGDVVLAVSHSWNPLVGLKSPKTNEARRVPILPEVRDELRALAAENPHGLGSKGFVFYSADPEKPMDQQSMLKALKEALIALSASNGEKNREKAEAEWARRNVVYHSWRHFYSSRMSDKLDSKKIMKMTGHKTASVFEDYAAHELENDLRDVAEAAGEAFGRIVPFSRKGA